MTVTQTMERGYLRLMDFFFDRRPQPRPPAERLAQCKLIAHRGEHDNATVLENTLDAFEQAAAGGVWGIELDVRWTRDGVPVVVHDADLQRLYGIPARIDQLTRQTLSQEVPAVPSLADVAARFGGRLHFMIEIKQVPWPDPEAQSRSLRDALHCLSPIEAYHLISMSPTLLSRLSGFPSRSLIAIAYAYPDRLSRWVARHQWGGLCAHYTMMRRSIIARHHRLGQTVGTGYPGSRNCLFREINRGIDWIFANNAKQLVGYLNPDVAQTG
jgi:glycerophosphoryl diester phosphodiesterase